MGRQEKEYNQKFVRNCLKFGSYEYRIQIDGVKLKMPAFMFPFSGYLYLNLKCLFTQSFNLILNPSLNFQF